MHLVGRSRESTAEIPAFVCRLPERGGERERHREKGRQRTLSPKTSETLQPYTLKRERERERVCSCQDNLRLKLPQRSIVEKLLLKAQYMAIESAMGVRKCVVPM